MLQTGPMLDGHCVYVMKQYYRLKEGEGKVVEKVYDCMNSWGFKDPFITIRTNHPAVMAIYKITPTIKRMTNNPETGRRSSGSQGSSSADYVFGLQTRSKTMWHSVYIKMGALNIGWYCRCALLFITNFG